MSEYDAMTSHSIRQITLPGECSNLDKGALVCDVIMLGIFIWNQLWYGVDMLFLIIPLALLGVYLLLFCVWAEEYCFTKVSLEVCHRFCKKVVIPYDTVFNYEASSRDTFINILQNNKVKVYYTQAKQKKTITCMPTDVETFVETLKCNCPEFNETHKDKSKLEVFF